MMRCLSRIKNIPRVLQAMHRKAQLKDWQSIIQIRQAFQAQELNEIGSLINDVLDFDESLVEGRCVVKPNVDEELDRMRQTYHGLGSFLSEVAKDISKTIPSHFASTINVVYFPQLGYLIAVPMNPNWKKEEDFYLDGLSYQFSTERAVYYKNSATRDREIDILQALQERIIEYSHLMVLCNDLCAELDAHPLQELCVESFVPNDTMLGEFHKDAFLSESESNSACHTETTTTRQSSFCVHCPGSPETINNNHVMILCGPNCSGKSVYIKQVMQVNFEQVLIESYRKHPQVTDRMFLQQVAMITYMAHIGSFVPADHALIGLTDKILTRLQTRETVSKVHSTFMADLSQVSMALRMATQRSLVVIDEFGKGTATTDGAGLFCAVIEHFARMESMQRPRVLATTHFHELFENRLMRVSDPSSRLPENNLLSSESDGSSATAYETTTADSKPLSSSLLLTNSPGAPLHSVHKASSSTHPSLVSTQPLPISIYTMEAVFDDSFHLDNDTCDPTIVTAGNGIPREPTFLFRVCRGRFPLSLGTACAITSGLPLPVVQRSIYLSHLFRRYEMVVPDLSRRDEARFEMYERLVSKLLQLKFDTGDLNRHQDGVQELKEEEDENENRKVESGLWTDIEALLDLAGQVEAFETSGSEKI
ncbi:MutS protein msh5 [Actinomortierella wolfii]|nr:MutS protein msh5 [Actinomortierella wolfii]